MIYLFNNFNELLLNFSSREDIRSFKRSKPSFFNPISFAYSNLIKYANNVTDAVKGIKKRILTKHEAVNTAIRDKVIFLFISQDYIQEKKLCQVN